MGNGECEESLSCEALEWDGGDCEVSCEDDEIEDCDGGYYVKPALLAGSLDNVAAREEIFGPVAYLAPFSDESEGIRLANNTDYGLANSVWSSDLARCKRVASQFEAGNGWINSHNVVCLLYTSDAADE